MSRKSDITSEGERNLTLSCPCMPWLSLGQCSQPSLGLHKSISGSGTLRAQSRKGFSTFPSLSCSRTASPAGEQRLERQRCGETASRKTQTSRLPCSPHRRHTPTHRKVKRNTYVIVNRGSDVLLKQLPIPIMLQQLLCCFCACCSQRKAPS